LSLVNAEDWQLVLFELLRLVKLLVLSLVVTNLRDDRQLRVLLSVLAVGALVQGGLAVIQYRWGVALGLGLLGEKALVQQHLGYVVSRATGTIGHPNILAYFFELLRCCRLAFRSRGASYNALRNRFLAGLPGWRRRCRAALDCASASRRRLVSLSWRRLLRPARGWCCLGRACLLPAFSRRSTGRSSGGSPGTITGRPNHASR
jgi:hypothetical protein